ncbi:MULTISPECIES: hypothetical protein [Sphingobacterium]|uniref:hypothetical protein n=1 Tax=Sphingobacterium TaxID=28453 RepID=UPI00258038D3|nr:MULTISPECIES: hypothetical protein [Sphingobacterium]
MHLSQAILCCIRWCGPLDNIEDMNVLKGATAAELYGSMGAGVAIMITTKKGLAE